MRRKQEEAEAAAAEESGVQADNGQPPLVRVIWLDAAAGGLGSGSKAGVQGQGGDSEAVGQGGGSEAGGQDGSRAQPNEAAGGQDSSRKGPAAVEWANVRLAASIVAMHIREAPQVCCPSVSHTL